MEKSGQLMCIKCNVYLEEKKTDFKYMTFTFSKELPCCPSCGQVFIPESLVKGQMAKVEKELEEK